jgi:hypothetical protein
MEPDDTVRTNRLLEMLNDEVHDAKITQNATLEVLKDIRKYQAESLASIRFNTNVCFCLLLCILISVSTGWFWE